VEDEARGGEEDPVRAAHAAIALKMLTLLLIGG